MRKVNRYFVGKDSVDGAGVRLKRCFGFYDTKDFDPFLLLDFFDSENPEDYMKGFPWHPHRGIETITYMMSGSMLHEDSLGNKGKIEAGHCQWMRAGSGILHQETPEESDYMSGTQLWLNMPAKEKMISPNYKDINSSNIGLVEEDDKIIRILAGEYKGTKGPLDREATHPTYLDISLDENTEFEFEVEDGYTFFALVVRGEVNFDEETERFIEKSSGVLFEREGTSIKFNSGDKKSRVLLIGGKPLNEEIAWRGPVVMNTQEEIDEAFYELNNGTFIKEEDLEM